MAAKELKITITWENAVQFKMTAKEGNDPLKLIAQMDENVNLPILWPSMQTLCETYFKKELEQIGNEMKG